MYGAPPLTIRLVIGIVCTAAVFRMVVAAILARFGKVVIPDDRNRWNGREHDRHRGPTRRIPAPAGAGRNPSHLHESIARLAATGAGRACGTWRVPRCGSGLNLATHGSTITLCDCGVQLN